MRDQKEKSPTATLADVLQRIGNHQTTAVDSRARLFSILAAVGVNADEADEMVCAIEAGAVAGVYSGVADMEADAPDGRGDVYGQGWFDGVRKVTNELAGQADRLYGQRGRAARFGLRVPAPATLERASDLSGPAEVTPEFVQQVLEIAERHYTELSGRSSLSPEDSKDTLAVVLPTVRVSGVAGYPQRLEEFAQANRVRLERLFRVYGLGGLYPDGVYGLVEWPESIVLCERIETDPLWLASEWADADYSELQLERLREAWLYGTKRER